MENLEAGFQTCSLGVEGNTIKWNITFKKTILSGFFTLSDWLSAELRTAFWVSRKTLWGFPWKVKFLSCFSEFEQISWENFEKSFRQCFQNWYLRVQKRFLTQIFWGFLLFLYQFRTLNDKLMWLLARMLYTCLSEVHSTSPENLFVRKNQFWPFKNMWLVSEFELKASGRFSKLPSTFPI